MGKPPTREIAGLVWTYDPERMEWRTSCGLCVAKFDDGYLGEGTAFKSATMFPTLRAACEAEVAHREAMRASDTLTPGELDRMLNEEVPTPPVVPSLRVWPDPEVIIIARENMIDVVRTRTAAGSDPSPSVTEEREAQRRDTRAYYRNLAGWALAALVLVALCSGVML